MNDQQDGLEVFVIFKQPADFPHSFVLRRQVVARGAIGDAAIVPDPCPIVVAAALDPKALENVRAYLPRGLTMITGPGGDPEPTIWEVWI